MKEVKINGKERKENNSNGVTGVDMKGVHGSVRTIHPWKEPLWSGNKKIKRSKRLNDAHKI